MKYLYTDSKDRKIRVFKKEEDLFVFFFIACSGAWEKDILEKNKLLINNLCQSSMTLMDNNMEIDYTALVDSTLNQTSIFGLKETIRDTLLRDTLALFYIDKSNECCHYFRIPSSNEISEFVLLKEETDKAELCYSDDTLISIKFDINIDDTDSDSGNKNPKIVRYIKIFILVISSIILCLKLYLYIRQILPPTIPVETYQVNLIISSDGMVSVKGIPVFPDNCLVEYAESTDQGLILDKDKKTIKSTKYPISTQPYLTRSCTVAVRVLKDDKPLTDWYYGRYNHEKYIVSLWQNYSKLSYEENRIIDSPTDTAMLRLFDTETSYCYIRYNKTVIDMLPIFNVAQFVDNTPMVIDSVSYFSKEIPLFVPDIDKLPKIEVVYCHPR